MLHILCVGFPLHHQLIYHDLISLLEVSHLF